MGCGCIDEQHTSALVQMHFKLSDWLKNIEHQIRILKLREALIYDKISTKDKLLNLFEEFSVKNMESK